MSNFLRQATASQIRALGPFLDDTDFKTAETALSIANTDIKLVVNGGVSANKNSGGGTHRVNGVYGVTFDATDTATVGEMEVSVVVAGALPVFKSFFVVEEVVYDALYAASAAGFGAGAITTADLGVVASGTAQAGSTTTTIVLAAATSFANDVINNATVVLISGTGVGQSRVIDDFVGATDTATISPAWDVTPDNTTQYRVIATPPGSTTNLPIVNVTKIGGQTVTATGGITFPAAILASTTGAVASVTGNVGGNVAGSVGSVTGAVGSVTGAVGSVTGAVGSVTGNVGGNVAGSVASVTGFTAANIATILGTTNKLDTALEADGLVYRFTVNAVELAPSGTGASAATITDAVFARTFHATKMAGMTFEEIIGAIASVSAAKVSGLPTAPVFRNLGDTANALSAATDTNGNRSSVTITLGSLR